MHRIALALLAASLPITAAAQRFELTPMVGYRWYGDFITYVNDPIGEEAHVDDSVAFALLLGFPLNPHMQIELLVDHQQTSITEGTLLSPRPDKLNVDIAYYHVGFLYQWTPNQLRPYVSGSLGVANLSPDGIDLRSEDRFSISIGGGIKVMVSERVSIRLDGRLFWTDTAGYRSRWGDDGCDWNNWDCWDEGWEEGHMDLLQREIKVGVGFLF